MQNLPITTSPQPVTPAQTSTPADNNTAETFGNVLARQRSGAGESSTDIRNKGQSTSSATDSAPIATGNELEASVPDVANMLPSDILATLLPATANTNSVAANKKPASQLPASGGTSTLPNDMLAALLSTSTTIQQGASIATQQRTMTNIQGGTPQFASAGQSIGEQTAKSLFRAQSNATPTITATDTTQGKTFPTMLETLGKEKDAATSLLSVGTTQTPAQAALPDAITLSSLTQSTTSPIPTSQNGPVQVAVNTPVTHDTWGDEFNQKVTWLATQHEQTAELHLNPPHLGPLDIVLNISGDQATALFTSPHAAVRDAVEQALPKLREMLADNGIMLGNATVNDQSPKEQQAGLADKQDGGNASLPVKIGDAVPAGGTVFSARRHQGMVDTFV